MFLLYFNTVLLLFWLSIPSLKGHFSADIPNLISTVNRITKARLNRCDPKNGLWEFGMGISPENNGFRAGKQDANSRNVTWFGFAFEDVQVGVTTSTLQNAPVPHKIGLIFTKMLYNIYGPSCKKGHALKSHQPASPAEQCAVFDGIGQCPENDDWSRVFVWLKWPSKQFMHSTPLGFEIKFKSKEESYHSLFSMHAGKQQVLMADILFEVAETGGLQRTFKVPMLGLEAFTTYAKQRNAKGTISTSDCSMMNKAGKKIFHLSEAHTLYAENSMSFKDFTFGVPHQDQERLKAILYRLKFEKSAPKVQRKYLHNIAFTARDLDYLSNETHNLWSNGAVEKWRFTNATSPLMKNPATINDVVIHKTISPYISGFKVTKYNLPFLMTTVKVEWTRETTVKKFTFDFNANSVVPKLSMEYNWTPTVKSLSFKFPRTDFGQQANFSYRIDVDGSFLWSVTGQENVDVMSGYIQHSSGQVLFVIKKNPLFAMIYTEFLVYINTLKELFFSTYGKIIYDRLVEEIGKAEMEQFLFTIEELPTLQMLYSNLMDISEIFDPEGWKTIVGNLYEALLMTGSLEETETSYVIHYDMGDLPAEFMFKYMYMLL